VIFDLDNFKAVVDGYGHLVGYRTIAQIGRTVAESFAPAISPRVSSGDQFVSTLPGTEVAEALDIAEAIRSSSSRAPRSRMKPSTFRRDRERRRRQLSGARRRRREPLPSGRHSDVLG
jgi:diguanylate cyclase (GGDEF)-like protein